MQRMLTNPAVDGWGSSTMFTIADIVAANRDAGQFYFSSNTMRAFKSRVLAGVIVVSDGTLFVTSECDAHNSDRRYSVRFAYRDGVMRGHVGNVSDFRQYATAAAARKAAGLAAASWSGIDNA